MAKMNWNKLALKRKEKRGLREYEDSLRREEEMRAKDYGSLSRCQRDGGSSTLPVRTNMPR